MSQLIESLDCYYFNVGIFSDPNWMDKKYEHTFNMTRNFVAFYNRHHTNFGDVLDT